MEFGLRESSNLKKHPPSGWDYPIRQVKQIDISLDYKYNNIILLGCP